MHGKKQNQRKPFYFSHHLRSQLSKIPQYGLTVVTAPTGFGKTAAIKECFLKMLPHTSKRIWLSSLDKPFPGSWKTVYDSLKKLHTEREASQMISDSLGPEISLDIIAALKSIQCDEDTYVIIDNCRYSPLINITELIQLFSLHGNPMLHFVAIFQAHIMQAYPLSQNRYIHTITSDDFLLNVSDIANLAKQKGLSLSQDDANSLHTYSEGWIALVLRQMEHYQSYGTFCFSMNIEQLINHAIWNQLSDVQKEFFLALALFDDFTSLQAKAVAGLLNFSENVDLLLQNGALIHFREDTNMYHLHQGLKQHLQSHLYHSIPDPVQKHIFLLAGKSCAMVYKHYLAAHFYLKAKDFDSIFLMPITPEYIASLKEESILEFFIEVVDACPNEVLTKYPLFLTTIALYMYLAGYSKPYQKLRSLILTLIKDSQLTEEASYISTILACTEEYNDLGKLSRLLVDSSIQGSASPKNICDVIPFPFGCPSILFLFWRESGQLDSAYDLIASGLPAYRKLTNGHGTGGDVVMPAELLLVRGDDMEAETLCYRALYIASSCYPHQTGICLCAELILVRICILRGDADGYFTAIKNMKHYAKRDTSQYITRMAELCQIAAEYFIGSVKSIHPWITDISGMEKAIYSLAIPYAQLLHSYIFFQRKQYNKFFGISAAILEANTKPNGTTCHLMVSVYCHKHIAMAYLKKGDMKQAQDQYKKALALALPDKVYLPLVQHADETHELIKSCAKTIENEETYKEFLQLYRRMEKGASIIKKAVIKKESPLSPREKEVAALVKSRLTAKEIAERLYITRFTAKAIIRNMYKKLNIHSRAELDTIDL